MTNKTFTRTAELHQVSLELALAKGLYGNATPSASEKGGDDHVV